MAHRLSRLFLLLAVRTHWSLGKREVREYWSNSLASGSTGVTSHSTRDWNDTMNGRTCCLTFRSEVAPMMTWQLYNCSTWPATHLHSLPFWLNEYSIFVSKVFICLSHLKNRFIEPAQEEWLGYANKLWKLRRRHCTCSITILSQTCSFFDRWAIIL